MNAILDRLLTPEVVSIVITVLLLPVIKGISQYIITFLGVKTDELAAKVKSDKIEHYLGIAEDVINTAITSVAQTYVDSLKKLDKFDTEAQYEAFIRAKDKALKMLSSESKKIIEDVYGDVNAWVENKIESFIKESSKN